MYKRKGGGEKRFLFSSELSCIYSKGGKVRKVHLLLLVPSLAAVEKINTQLGWIGNLKSDGRPILGIDAKEVAKIVLDADPSSLVVPAHIWTPWFSVFGSKSGFNSLEECFDEYTKHIYAVETGLSSDPAMNWRLSALDNITLLSNSDSHSLEKIGREVNVFDTELSYPAIREAIVTKDPAKFLFTVEFFPEECKSHLTGPRKCGVSQTPGETDQTGTRCPECGRPLTLGVLHRVRALSGDEIPQDDGARRPFARLVPLIELLAQTLGKGRAAKSVGLAYRRICIELGGEIQVLAHAGFDDLERASGEALAIAVTKVRDGQVQIVPGFDGQYGTVRPANE